MFFTRKKKGIVQLELQMMFYDVCEKCYAQSVAMKVCAFLAKIPTIINRSVGYWQYYKQFIGCILQPLELFFELLLNTTF